MDRNMDEILGKSRTAIGKELKATKDAALAAAWYSYIASKVQSNGTPQEEILYVAKRINTELKDSSYLEQCFDELSPPDMQDFKVSHAEFYTQLGDIAKTIFTRTEDLLWGFEWYECKRAAHELNSNYVKQEELQTIQEAVRKKLKDPAWKQKAADISYPKAA